VLQSLFSADKTSGYFFFQTSLLKLYDISNSSLGVHKTCCMLPNTMPSAAQRAFVFVVSGTFWITGIAVGIAAMAFIGSRLGTHLAQIIMRFFEDFHMVPLSPQEDSRVIKLRKQGAARAVGAILLLFVWIAAFVYEASTWTVGSTSTREVVEGALWSAVAAVGLFAVLDALVLIVTGMMGCRADSDSRLVGIAANLD
jgi:hypothetical protein